MGKKNSIRLHSYLEEGFHKDDHIFVSEGSNKIPELHFGC